MSIFVRRSLRTRRSTLFFVDRTPRPRDHLQQSSNSSDPNVPRGNHKTILALSCARYGQNRGDITATQFIKVARPDRIRTTNLLIRNQKDPQPQKCPRSVQAFGDSARAIIDLRWLLPRTFWV